MKIKAYKSAIRQFAAVLMTALGLFLASGCSSQEEDLIAPSAVRPAPAAIIPGEISRLTNNAQSFLPSWSPDSKTIAYFSSTENQIFLMEADGSNDRRLTDQLATSFGPAVWSPDGTRIAFAVSQWEGKFHVIQANGEGLVHLADDLDGGYVWTADGEQIAFVASVGGQFEIVLIDADGSNRQSLFRSTAQIGGLFRPSQSEDIYVILSEDDTYTISRVDLEDAEITRLSALPADVYEAVISPDGLHVAYSSDAGLGIMRVDGSEQKILVDAEGGTPSWSPDGGWIAFALEGEDHDVDIFAINIDGKGLVNLTQHSAYADFDPIWSPDGSRLAFIACSYVEGLGYGADHQVYVVTLSESTNQ